MSTITETKFTHVTQNVHNRAKVRVYT